MLEEEASAVHDDDDYDDDAIDGQSNQQPAAHESAPVEDARDSNQSPTSPGIVSPSEGPAAPRVVAGSSEDLIESQWRLEGAEGGQSTEREGVGK